MILKVLKEKLNRQFLIALLLTILENANRKKSLQSKISKSNDDIKMIIKLSYINFFKCTKYPMEMI